MRTQGCIGLGCAALVVLGACGGGAGGGGGSAARPDETSTTSVAVDATVSEGTTSSTTPAESAAGEATSLRGATVTTARTAGTAKTSATTAKPAAVAAAAVRAKVALDPKFGANGLAKVPLSSSDGDRFSAVAIAADGRIYGAGFTTSGSDQSFAVARLTPEGQLDPTFGQGGVASVNIAPGGRTAEQARGVVVQSTGAVVIAGPVEHDPSARGDAAKDTDIAVARFDSAGRLDTTFGTGGTARIDLGTGRTAGSSFVGDSSWGLTLLPGDRLGVVGSTIAEPADRTDTDFAFVALSNNGNVDSAFGDKGVVRVDVAKGIDSPRQAIVQPDGKIVFTGYTRDDDGLVSIVLVRVHPDGRFDGDFGKNGVSTARPLNSVSESYDVALQNDRIITAGYGKAEASEKVDIIVSRFASNGALDKSFGKDGVARIDLAGEDDRARDVAVLADGRVLVAGSAKPYPADQLAAMVLLEADGRRASDFGDNGILLTDMGGSADTWYGVKLNDQRTAAAIVGYKGVATGEGNDDAAVLRLTIS